MEQYHPYTTFAGHNFHNDQQMNDHIEPDTLVAPKAQFSIPSGEGRGNDRMLKDVHQPAEKKQKPGTPKTPSIIIPRPSKKGYEDYEGSNAFMDESFIETLYRRNSRR